jgi:hypothetical protein
MSATLVTVAKDVKAQIEFNSVSVIEYRQIGYEKRQLDNEDFNDDAVDAGDIGEGKRVTVLYGLTLAGSKPSVDPLRYQPSPASSEDIAATDMKPGELAYLKFRWKTPDGDRGQLTETPVMKSAMAESFESAGNALRFSAAVAAYGQKLRDNPNLKGEMKMKSKTPKFIALALATALLASAVSSPIPAAAVPGDAKDLRGGHWTEQHRWIAFGRYDGKPIIWRVLETGKTDKGNPMAFLLANGCVEDAMRFDRYKHGGNDWNDSDIKRWLNDDFYHAAFSKKEQDAIVNSAYYYGGKYEGGDKKDASKVFLLSADDAENGRFFANDADRLIGSYWWLRSPDVYEYCAAYVSYRGEVIGDDAGSSVDDELGVRPALKINLASSIFTSSSSKYEILYPVTVKVRDAVSAYHIRGAAVAADSPRQKYLTGEDGTVILKLGAGKQKIRVSVAGREVREITLYVEPGIGVIVDIK